MTARNPGIITRKRPASVPMIEHGDVRGTVVFRRGVYVGRWFDARGVVGESQPCRTSEQARAAADYGACCAWQDRETRVAS